MTKDDPRIRRPRPGRLGRWLARAPSYLFRLGLGWLLGRRFLLLEHIGRTTGLPRETVLEVIRREDDAVFVAAAWGAQSDWLRNVVANPAVRVSTGRLKRRRARALVVTPEAAAEIFRRYAEDHPKAARALASTLGLPLDDPDAMARTVPVVRLAFETA